MGCSGPTLWLTSLIAEASSPLPTKLTLIASERFIVSLFLELRGSLVRNASSTKRFEDDARCPSLASSRAASHFTNFLRKWRASPSSSLYRQAGSRPGCTRSHNRRIKAAWTTTHTLLRHLALALRLFVMEAPGGLRVSQTRLCCPFKVCSSRDSGR